MKRLALFSAGSAPAGLGISEAGYALKHHGTARTADFTVEVAR
jgi:hypothetical protein